MQEVLAEVCRGDGVESVHYGSIVVVNNSGDILYYAGDPNLTTFTRSSLKPFQVTPLVERDGISKFGIELSGLAIMCGSHAGTDAHVQQVKSNLDKIGLNESYLQCGTHPPIYYAAQNILPHKGEIFNSLQHNCSGKHSGQLALTLMLKGDPQKYLEPDSATQIAVRQAVSDICEVPSMEMKVGTDGCSLPNYAFPIKNLALGYANIGTLKGGSENRKRAFKKIIEAIQTHPVMVSGDMRSDYYLMQALPKEIISKIGGESVQGLSILSKKWGIAIKIADGNPRALGPVVVETLRQLGILDDSRLSYVEKLVQPQVLNNRNRVVGHIRPAFKLKRG